MGTIKITLSANAGICLEIGDCVIWIDALHRHKTINYSTITENRWEKIKTTFPKPDILFFTHKHPDHYSKTLITETKKLYPDAKIISPVNDFSDQLLLSGTSVKFKYKDIDFNFIKLLHAGQHLRDVVNYGLILTYKGKTWMFPGDCEVGYEKLNQHFDYAFLTFPWVTLNSGRKFIEENITPEEIFIFHVPFKEDNVSGFRESIEKSLPLLDSKIKVHVFDKEFDFIEIPD